EGRHPSELRRHRGALLLRQHLHHPLDEGRSARRAVLRVPSLLHRQAEAGGLRWAYRPLRASLRAPQEEHVAPLSTLDPEGRGALLQTKVAALVRGHFGVEAVTGASFPGGAAARADAI